MDSDAEIDAAVVRHANIALDEAILHRNGRAHGLDHAAKLGDEPIASALDYPPMMDGDGGIDQLRAQRSQPRQSSVLVRAREPAVADDVRHQDRSNLPDFGHGRALTHHAIPQERFDPCVSRSKRSGKKSAKAFLKQKYVLYLFPSREL